MKRQQTLNRLQPPSLEARAQVIVKCHLRDDDAEEVEVLELPSSCVRHWAAIFDWIWLDTIWIHMIQYDTFIKCTVLNHVEPWLEVGQSSNKFDQWFASSKSDESVSLGVQCSLGQSPSIQITIRTDKSLRLRWSLKTDMRRSVSRSLVPTWC